MSGTSRLSGIRRLRCACGRGVVIGAVVMAASVAGAGTPLTCITDICFEDVNVSGAVIAPGFVGPAGAIDANNDGFMDIFLGANFNQPNALLLNVPNAGTALGRSFVNVAAAAGLNDADGNARRARGIVAADFDNNGWTDLYLLGIENSDATSGLLYLNDGGIFTNVSVESGVRATSGAPESASAVDFDLDGDLDVLIAHAASGLLAKQIVLLENDGLANFTDATFRVPTVNGAGRIYAHIWSDYDADGDGDCFALTTAIGPTLLRNDVDGEGGRFFSDVANEVGFSTLGNAPMGITAQDFDNDLDVDIALTNGLDGAYYENLGGGTVLRLPDIDSIWGWGIFGLDAENDGDLDMYQAGSLGIGANVDRLFRNDGPWTFTDVSAALNTTSLVSQYSMRIDIDNDGYVDMVTSNPGQAGLPTNVYHNVSPSPNHWIAVKLEGDGVQTNRSAVGALVRVTAGGVTQVREIHAGSSTTTTEDLRQHFGLGHITQVESIEVVWPRAGSVMSRTELFDGPFSADQIITLERNACEGDADGDFLVDVNDITYVVFRLGNTGPIGKVFGDVDFNGAVNVNDITYVVFRLGTCV